MPETSIVEKIHKWKPFTGRPVGRPKSQCEDNVSKRPDDDETHKMDRTSPRLLQMERNCWESQVVVPSKKNSYKKHIVHTKNTCKSGTQNKLIK